MASACPLAPRHAPWASSHASFSIALPSSSHISSCVRRLFFSLHHAYTILPVEKVYIVWPNKGTRMSSTAYKVGFVAMGGFVVVLVMMFIGRIAYIRDDRQCVIGLHRAASMTTLFVDLGVNILLTSMFLWPLWRSNFVSINIRRVASRTLVYVPPTQLIPSAHPY